MVKYGSGIMFVIRSCMLILVWIVIINGHKDLYYEGYICVSGIDPETYYQ